MFATLLWIRERFWISYAIPVVASLAGLLLRFAIGHHLPGAPFFTFIPAVLVSVLAGGFGPGLLAVVISAFLGNYFFVAPTGLFSFSKGWSIGLAFFFVAGIIMFLVNALMTTNFRLSHAMEMLRTNNDSLETRIAARTAELMEAEAQLHQSQKMEALGHLTGGITHDFNNLLTGIAGSLEMLHTRLQQGRLEDLPRHVSAARESAARGASLTQRLLAFARRQSLEPRATDINALVGSMEDLIRRTIDPGIILNVTNAASLWTTLVDPNQLELALLNLCINASDAMPAGGNLIIKTENHTLDGPRAKALELSPGQYVSLSICDNGTGMEPDVMEHAFDPFFTTKPVGQGTGLGLSMVYGFVRQSGGHVRICSTPGQGTSVYLYLLRHDGAAEAAKLHDPSREPPALSKTVLVVDNDPAERARIADLLRQLDYTALRAEDGPNALKILQSSRRINLLITDVGLPHGMNGRQLAEAARALRPNLQVLFITSYADNTLIRQIILPPGMHVLPKPFAPAALATRIQKLLTAEPHERTLTLGENRASL
jgi:signal transduction histidine kinase/ActR/RegA family two-component response regulator